MYRSIQVVSSYRIDRINEHGSVSLHDKCDGQISALLKGGSTKRAPFGGFIEASNLIGLQRVKIIDIHKLCEDDEGEKPTYQIPNNHYVVGTYLERKLFITLENGEPKHFSNGKEDLDSKYNVVSLFN
jgi:hypothetical protein